MPDLPPPAQNSQTANFANLVIKLECWIEYDVCTPLANLERKIFIWSRFMA